MYISYEGTFPILRVSEIGLTFLPILAEVRAEYVYLSIYLSVYLSIYLSIYPSIHPSIYLRSGRYSKASEVHCECNFFPEDRGSSLLRNVNIFLTDCMASHPRKQYSSCLLTLRNTKLICLLDISPYLSSNFSGALERHII
jgi:hypothetical protein